MMRIRGRVSITYGHGGRIKMESRLNALETLDGGSKHTVYYTRIAVDSMMEWRLPFHDGSQLRCHFDRRIT
jgi:hypothetical protein